MSAESEALYTEIASDYDRHLLEDCAYGSPAAVARLLARGRHAKHPHRPLATQWWLELGAGTGLLGRACKREGFAPRWVALDLSQAMLREIRLGSAAPAYRASLRATALAPLPFTPACFDGAAAVGLLEHVLVLEPLLAQLYRVLRPGATFVFTYTPRLDGRVAGVDGLSQLVSHDARYVLRCLAAAGFERLSSQEHPAYIDGPQTWVTHRTLLTRKRDY